MQLVSPKQYSDYLAHHGILGQKWGKTNGPPYPLRAGEHSASEKKAGWRKSLAKTENVDNKSKRTYTSSKESFRLTSNQKRAIKIGAGIMAVGLAAYGAYKIGLINKTTIDNGQQLFGSVLGFGGNADSENNSDRLKAGLKFKGKFQLPSNVDEIRKLCVAELNPTDSRTNCGSCAVAAVLNTAGFDVKSLPDVSESMRTIREDGSLGNGYDPHKLLSAFKGAKSEDLMGNYLNRKDACSKVTTKLEDYGDGAFGLLWTDKMRGRSSGHYVGWRIIGGKLHILEAQPVREGIIWDDFFEGIGRNMDPATLTWARLDTCEPIPELIKDVVQNK